jgi:hypothetical protein
MRKFLANKLTLAASLSMLTLTFALADHGPTMPPNPWDGFAAVRAPAGADHGPTMPPNPWDGIV